MACCSKICAREPVCRSAGWKWADQLSRQQAELKIYFDEPKGRRRSIQYEFGQPDELIGSLRMQPIPTNRLLRLAFASVVLLGGLQACSPCRHNLYRGNRIDGWSTGGLDRCNARRRCRAEL